MTDTEEAGPNIVEARGAGDAAEALEGADPADARSGSDPSETVVGRGGSTIERGTAALYHSPRRAATVLVVLFLGWVIVAGMGLGASGRLLQLVNRASINELAVDLEFYDTVAQLAAAFTLIQMLLFVVTGVVFIVWTHAAYQNGRALGIRELRFSTGWSIGAWFVPFLNLVRPKQIVDDCWAFGDPDAPRDQPSEWMGRRVPVYFHLWWGAYLISGILSVFGSSWDLNATIDEFRRDLILEGLSTVVLIGAAVAAAAVVVTTTSRQDARHAASEQILEDTSGIGRFGPVRWASLLAVAAIVAAASGWAIVGGQGAGANASGVYDAFGVHFLLPPEYFVTETSSSGADPSDMDGLVIGELASGSHVEGIIVRWFVIESPSNADDWAQDFEWKAALITDAWGLVPRVGVPMPLEDGNRDGVFALFSVSDAEIAITGAVATFDCADDRAINLIVYNGHLEESATERAFGGEDLFTPQDERLREVIASVQCGDGV